MERAVVNFAGRLAGRRDERGVTLVELVMGVVLLSMITGAIGAAFVTAFNDSRPTLQRVRESNDAQLVAGFLVRDAQSAGTVDPGRPGYPPLSSNDPYYDSGVSLSNDAGCSASGTVKLRFKWFEPTGSVTSSGERIVDAYVVVYRHAGEEIVRTICEGNGPLSSFVPGTAPGSASTLTLASHAVTVTSSCDPVACPAIPDTVSLEVTESNDPQNAPTPYTYRLTAAVRPESQTAPDGSTATAAPLLTLGGCSTQPSVDLDGSPDVVVFGSIVVNNSCNPIHESAGADFRATGGIVVANPPFPDPFASLPPPAFNCTSDVQATHGQPGTYKSNVTFQNETLAPGIYIFCNNVTFQDSVVANGVLLYVVNGTFDGSNADITASAMTSGLYGSQPGGANIVVWQARTDSNQMVLCCANTASASFDGTIYAPSATVQLKNADMSIERIVAFRVLFGPGGGTHSTVIGTRPACPVALGAVVLPAWTVNVVYPSQTLSATCGSGGYVFSAAGLPPGLSIDSLSGVISGTPTATGTYTVNAMVTDSIGEQDIEPVVLRVNPPPTISTATLPNWTINRTYPGTAVAVTAGTGTAPYTWAATGLPNGLTINTTNGTISGTPTATGTTSGINVTVTDAAGVSTNRDYTITINSPPTITGPSALPTDRTATVAYPSTTMTANNGTTPYRWSASGLPPGLNIGANSGVISGTPTTAGTYNVTVTLTDAAGATDTRAYSVVINPGPGISTNALPIGEQAVAYSPPNGFTLTPTGQGTPPFTWTATGLPAGLSIGLTTGTISGTPTVSGTFAVTVTITDAQGGTANRNYSLQIATVPTVNGPAVLPDWTVNRDYTGTQATASGGVTPYTWSATGLPDGLAINGSTGVITGTPTVVGQFPVTITLVDALGGTATRNFTARINPTPSVSTASLPDGEQNVAYSAPVAAVDGTLPYFWSASGLPAGMNINAITGAIGGTPTAGGPFTVTVTVTDRAGASASADLALLIHPPPTIDGGTLPDWTVGVVYPPTTFSAISGVAPYTWSATNLPPGLTMSTAGQVSGTPTTAGTRTVTVTATDSLGGTASQTYSVTIFNAPVITTGSLPAWTVGRPYNDVTMSATGGATPLAWSASGLPDGLNMSNTGVISGTPTTEGSAAVTVTVTDNNGATANRNYTLDINPDPSIPPQTLPDAHENMSYSTTLDADDGAPPYSWSAPGPLPVPAGLTLSSGGVLSGTPTVIGSFTIDVELTDASGATASGQVSLTIHPELILTAPVSLQAWTINRSYPAVNATATGGFGAYTWSASGLPVGMSIDPSTGAISGTPTASGTFNVGISVTDSASPPGTRNRTMTLTINPALQLSKSNCAVHNGTPISFSVNRTGGTNPVTWSATGLAFGLSLNTSTGVISGTPNAANQTTINVTVNGVDAAGSAGGAAFVITFRNGGGTLC